MWLSRVKGQSVACFVLLMMGVRDLWKVLSRAKRKVDIGDLRGKTLAVDLSWWVCEFSSVKGKSLDCGLHACMNGSELTSFSLANSLKNLFYRILHLYSAGVGLVNHMW